MGLNLYYKLDKDKQVVPADNVISWARWFESAERVVRKTTLLWRGGEKVEISTVFLGMDHRMGITGEDGEPLLFETMVFGGPGEVDEYQVRWETWDKAELGHGLVVENVRKVLADSK